MPQRVYFAKTLRGNVDAGGLCVIRDEAAHAPEERHYQKVTVENETNTAGNARIGIEQAGGFVLADYFGALTVDVPQVSDDSEIVAKPGERLEVRIASATAADLIAVNVHGYVWSS